MATADELLRTTTASDTEAETSAVLTANFATRTITIPGSIRVLGVESDDDTHRLHFNVPRYFGEFDLSEFDVRINFENAKREGDLWPVDDLVVSNDGESMSFSWLVDRSAYVRAGDVTFSICMKKYDADGEVVKEFNTTTATLPVLEGLETGKAVVDNNTTVLDKLLFRLYAVEAASGMGQNGYYTVLRVEEDEDGVIFTVLNQDGETEAFVRNGKDGKNGENGADGTDGYTPVYGVDYWTPEEESEIRSDLTAALKAYVDGWAPRSVTTTLTSSGWSDNKQTVNISGVTSDTIVFISPDPDESNYATYNDNAIRCISKGEGTLTFSCESVPSTDLLVEIAVFHTSDETTSPGNLIVTDDGKGNVVITR